MGGGSGDTGDKKQLGKILLKQKLVTPEELDELLARQRAEPGTRLASAAVQSGKVREVDLLKALSEQHGLPGIDLQQVVVPLANLRLIPEEIAKQHLILPILVKDDRVFLAMADPGDRRVIDEIEFVTGRRVFPYVALHHALRDTIAQSYRLLEQNETYYVGPNVPADYLAQIGLDGQPGESTREKKASTPPDPGPAIVVERPPTAGAIDDDLSLSGGGAQGGVYGIDPAFASRVAALPSEERRPRPATPRILIVDDEVDIRRLLRRVLTEKGFEVVEASKGSEALELVKTQTPDIILLDAMLPEVHGFDICRRIKGSKRYGHIPIVMVSAIYRGWRFAEDLKQSYGVAAFLEKPFKISDVVGAVERALEGREETGTDEDEMSREAGESLARSMEAFRAGDLDSAIDHLRQAVGIDPLSFKLRYHLGLLYGRRDDIFDGIHELETAVDLQPRHFSALKNLAVLYQRAGFKHKAVEMWERALAGAPDDTTRQGIKEHLMSLL